MKYLGSTMLVLLCALSALAQEYPQLTNLPTLYIDTQNHRPIDSKTSYINATLRYVDAEGERYYDALGIRGRGNSTWGLAKKPYRIKFDKKQEFLGPERAKAKSWTLLANYSDKSLMRNALASCVGDFAGLPFTAAAQFADLVLNGRYVGNYQISDQVEIRGKRVDIVEQDEPMTDDSDITGGYLLEVDGFADAEPCHFSTSRGVRITVKSPDDDIIDQRQVDYIRNYIQNFENVLFSNNFTDPNTGYRRYIDEATLVSWYVASEMTGNPDAFWSTYIYKNQGDPKIYWGPLWDYDIAFNNCRRLGDMTRRAILTDAFGACLTEVWVRRMWEDPWFVKAVNEKWKSMIADGLEKHLIDFIDNKEAVLSASQVLDGELWPIDAQVYDEYMLFSTYSATVDFLRKYVRERIAFLTGYFGQAAEGTQPNPPFECEDDYYYRIHSVQSLKCADLTAGGAAVCGNSYVVGTDTQQWSFKATDDDCYMIINRSNGQAITDMATLNNGTYQPGAQLSLAAPDARNKRQLWQIVSMPAEGVYAIVNRATGLAWNNSGNNVGEGNPWISWNSDSSNSTKPNRQWRIIRDELKDNTGIEDVSADIDYLVTYSPSGSVIRFVVPAGTTLTGTYSITNLSGVILRSGPIAESLDVSTLPTGTYILAWEIDGHRAATKFVKL